MNFQLIDSDWTAALLVLWVDLLHGIAAFLSSPFGIVAIVIALIALVCDWAANAGFADDADPFGTDATRSNR